jgi:hypothetical protein
MNKLRNSLVLMAVVTIAGVMPVRADQPEMQAALADLRSAKHHLERAMHDKGGYRVKAEEQINAAIHSVERGMEVSGR